MRPHTIPLEPQPDQVVIAHTTDDATGAHMTTVIRRWTNGLAARCQLCAVCTYLPGTDGRGVCIIHHAGQLEPELALSLPPGLPATQKPGDVPDLRAHAARAD